MPYSTPSDLFAFGVPRGSTPNPGRPLASMVGSVCALDVHGFATDDEILFRSQSSPMPAGLSENVTYYAQPETEHTFRVRATLGGASISFSDPDPEDVFLVIAPLPKLAAIAWADRMIDDMVPAHVIPFSDPVPEIIRMTSAELAAGKLLSMNGSSAVSLSTMVDAAAKRLERWGKGVPVPGANALRETRDNISAVAVSPYCDRRGWNRFGGL